MLRGRNAGHEGLGEFLARLGRDAGEASHGGQRCWAACPCLSPHPAPRRSGFIPHFLGQPHARDFLTASRAEPHSPRASGGARNLQISYVCFLAILDTGRELLPLGGWGCNSQKLQGKAEKERNKRGGEAARRGRGSRGFPRAPANASGARFASGSLGCPVQGLHRSLGRYQAGSKALPAFYDRVGALVGMWLSCPLALCLCSPAPSQCFLLVSFLAQGIYHKREVSL